MHSVSSVAGDKEGEFVGGVGAAEAAVALPLEGGGALAKHKNVAWEDTEKEEEAAEKVSGVSCGGNLVVFSTSSVQASQSLFA